jgi:hypothetical protein
MCIALGCSSKPALDTAQQPEWTDPALLLVSETSSGRVLVVDPTSGAFTGEVCLREIFPDSCSPGSSELARPCLMFGFEHSRTGDADTLLFTATLRDPDRPFAPSAIGQIDLGHPPNLHWAIRDIQFPQEWQQGFDCTADPEAPQCHLYGAHTVERLEDGTLLVSDTSNSRILWLEPPESGARTARVHAVLSSQHPEWGMTRYPNMVQSLLVDDQPHILVTLKGRAGTGRTPTNEGGIALWNVSDRTQPKKVWAFPEEGHLAAVHGGRMIETPHGSLLVYAHSLGAANPESGHREGTVGFARFNGADPPEYLADGRLPEPGFGFTREVEWAADLNQLLVTDSGCENAQDDCSRMGRVVTTALPLLTDTDNTGSAQPDGGDQTFVELEWKRSAVDAALELPFDTDRLPLSAVGPSLENGLGNCPER